MGYLDVNRYLQQGDEVLTTKINEFAMANRAPLRWAFGSLLNYGNVEICLDADRNVRIRWKSNMTRPLRKKP